MGFEGLHSNSYILIPVFAKSEEFLAAINIYLVVTQLEIFFLIKK